MTDLFSLDETSSDTVALTIEIDEDYENSEGSSKEHTKLTPRGANVYSIPRIRPPKTVEALRIMLPSSVRITSLSPDSLDVLCSHLHLPAFGSLRNWQSIAASLGMSADSIMSFHLQDKPMEVILSRFSDQSINKLLIAIEDSGRIDTLYSLKELHKQGRLLLKHPEKKAAVANRSMPVFPQSIHSISTSDAASLAASRGEKYILVTHYETTPDERKQFKWLLKNLRENELNSSRIPVYDVDSSVSEENVVESIQDVFRQAHHIIACFTPSYVSIDRFEPTPGNTRLEANQHLMRLMNAEFFQQNSQNKRFRAVIFKALGDVTLPVGWPSSTVQYSFPDQAKKLFQRLFDPPTQPSMLL